MISIIMFLSFCVVFLVYTLFVLYPVLRVSALCFWFIRCVSCIQYYVFLCCVFGLYVVCLVSSIPCLNTTQKHAILDTRQTTYKPKNTTQKHVILDTRQTTYKPKTLVYTLCVLYPVLRVSVFCFWLYVVCLVSSITCFCILFLVYTLCVLY
jgi:hypothetical protein